MSGFLPYLPQIIAIGALLALSALLSVAETALFSLSRAQTHPLAEGRASERAARQRLRTPQRLLNTVLVGSLTMNVLLTSDCAATADRLEVRTEWIPQH